MPLVEDIIHSRFSIQAYDNAQVTINDKTHVDSLVLSSDQLITPWPVHDIRQLNPEQLQCIFELNPEVVLLGTGERQQFPDVEILGLFAEQRIGLEVMNTGALCRTFNILVAENRQVVAAIIQSRAED